MCKNVFAVNNGIIVLTFHAQDLTKGCGRDLHGARPNPRSDMDWQMSGDLSNEPTNER